MNTRSTGASKCTFQLFLFLLLGTLCACSTLRTDFVKKPSAAIAPIADTSATRYVQAEAAAHPGQSGFRLLVSNQNALMSRIVLTDQARHSIDLQYYIFANDATGRLLAQRLLAAADRGVRVRLLLDDIDIANEDDLLNALDVHPNIEVRLFNPFRYRQRSMPSKVAQFLLEGARLNRRMHNKSFIVDGMQAIIGGRNIGDAYFDVGDDVHFRDLDALAIGPVVPEIAASFDVYWNSDAVFPVRAYSGDAATRRNLAQARAALGRSARTFSESDYAQALAWELPNGPSADQRGGWLWGDARMIADSPEKADPDEDPRSAHIEHQVRGVLDAARQQALLVSPYYIPGDEGVSLLEALRGRGVDIKVLTNSLAATDEPEVLAAYARYRRRLLRAGVELYEFRPIGGSNKGSALGRSSGVSLHAKAMVVDHHDVFIGSMNFDPRSRYLNTEMGVIADSPALAAAVEQFFAHATTPQNSFQVMLEPASGASSWRALRWIGTVDGKTVQYSHDPDVSTWKRVEADLMRFLPIEGLL